MLFEKIVKEKMTIILQKNTNYRSDGLEAADQRIWN